MRQDIKSVDTCMKETTTPALIGFLLFQKKKDFRFFWVRAVEGHPYLWP